MIFCKVTLFSRGPEDTCFEGGVFPARLTFPPDYPLGPPKMKFTCDLFHPNSKFHTLAKALEISLNLVEK